MDILQTLENALLNLDPNIRSQAEQQLDEAAKGHFIEYIGLLSDALANEEAKTEVRMLAAIGLKNQLTAREVKTKIEQQNRWIALDPNIKAKIKEISLKVLMTKDDRVANTAAQLVAAIADMELPRTEWPELIPIVIENTKTDKPVNIKRAFLLTIGYICDSADPNNPAIIAQANGILIAIVQGVQSSEPSKIVRLTALNALVNSLEFIKFNFEREGERNYIMQVVCEATQSEDTEIQASAFGCLARIMALYYRFMALYMEKALYGLTITGMHSTDDRVACMAVEFWSTVCEEELEISLQREEYGASVHPELISYNFAIIAIQDILPTLLTLLTRQNEDPEDDDWSVAMAAGSCLQLFAQNTGNYVVETTLQFVAANLANASSWRAREAAVMAFASILDGPDRALLKSLIGEALEPILILIKDDYLQVKETVAWCLGRIADLVVDAIDVNTQLPRLLEALVYGLQDHPKVSTNCCWTLMNLSEQLCVDASSHDTCILSMYYEPIIPILIQLSNKLDNDFSSRASAYEALSTFVIYSANDTVPIIHKIASEVLGRLESTISMQHQILTSEDRANLEELQVNILSLLTNIIRRLSDEVRDASDNLMAMFLKLLESQEPNALIEEDIFIAISACANATGQNFLKYMDAFLPYLTKALQNTESPTCNTAVGMVADLAQSLGNSFLPYLEGLMSILGSNLNNAEVDRNLRPAILSCFGDIAAAIGKHFQRYTDFVMQICISASNMEPTDASIETIDYILNIQESILDCYVGVVGGLHDCPHVIYPYVASIFQFLQFVSIDVNMSNNDSVARSATGLLGDLAAMYPAGEFKQAYMQPWVTEFIKKTRANHLFLQSTKDAARWARDQQKKQVAA